MPAIDHRAFLRLDRNWLERAGIIRNFGIKRELDRIATIRFSHWQGAVNRGTDLARGAGIVDYDLITLDMKMPGMGGIEALKRIREKERQLPVIICSAYGEYQQDFSTWACDAYVVKSADLTELKSTIRKLLGL